MSEFLITAGLTLLLISVVCLLGEGGIWLVQNFSFSGLLFGFLILGFILVAIGVMVY